MLNTDTEGLSRQQVLREIARIVDAASVSGTVIATGSHAADLLAAYPDAHWSIGHLVDEIVVAAATANVPVLIVRPHPESS